MTDRWVNKSDRLGLSKKVTVCLDWGEARFTVPERELSVLVTGEPVDGWFRLKEANRA